VQVIDIMTLTEAKIECNRWFAHLQRQRDKSIAMQRIATALRAGELSHQEAQRQVRTLDSGMTVYDGANLELAVRILLKHSGQTH
jgi:Tfp pilus assembly protein PilX